MKRCTKCVLPENTPNISFDKDGVCNYCHTYQKYNPPGEGKLLEILNEHRGKNKKYDAIVTLSGGRDSSYVLLKLVKDYNMKVLAVNYDSPFLDPQAKENIKNIVDILNIDLEQFKLRKNLQESTLKNNYLAWCKQPSPAMIPMMCIGCKNIWYEILKIARRFKINCIISGGNPLEYSAFKKELIGLSRDGKEEYVFMKSLAGLIKESTKNLQYYNSACLPVMVKGYLFGDPYALGSRIIGYNIDKIDLFHYIKWDEKEILSRIENELNWRKPERFQSSWRFDCQIGHLKDYMYLKTLKMTERDDFYSKMIREGMITREEALKRLELENCIYLDDINCLLEKIGLDNIKDGNHY